MAFEITRALLGMPELGSKTFDLGQGTEHIVPLYDAPIGESRWMPRFGGASVKSFIKPGEKIPNPRERFDALAPWDQESIFNQYGVSSYDDLVQNIENVRAMPGPTPTRPIIEQDLNALLDVYSQDQRINESNLRSLEQDYAEAPDLEPPQGYFDELREWNRNYQTEQENALWGSDEELLRQLEVKQRQNVMPSGWDEFYTDPAPETMTGEALNEWLRRGGTLQANTPSGIPGQPSEWRGITGEDVIPIGESPLGEEPIHRGLEALNPLQWASAIPPTEGGGYRLLSNVARFLPKAAAIGAGLYGGYRGLQAWGEKGAGEARVSEPLIDYPTNIHPPIQRGGYIGVTPLTRGIGWRSPASSLISHTDSGVGGDEIPTTADVMPVIPPPTDFRSNMPVYDPPAVSFSRATPQVFYTDSGPMPTQEQIDISVENLGRLHREAQQAGTMESQVKQALTDYGRGKDAGELQAIAEMTYTDPVSNDEEMFFEKYLDPTRQEAIDIKSQVDSFSALQEADQQRMEREAKQEAARQEQVRADNERRAEEAREEQDRARENRERQEAQAERAKAIAKRSKAADDRKAAARAQARADAAAQRERQATIQRQEDNRRRQATERAAKQAEQARKAAIAAAKPTPVRRRRGGRPASRRVWKQPSRGRGR